MRPKPTTPSVLSWTSTPPTEIAPNAIDQRRMGLRHVASLGQQQQGCSAATDVGLRSIHDHDAVFGSGRRRDIVEPDTRSAHDDKRTLPPQSTLRQPGCRTHDQRRRPSDRFLQLLGRQPVRTSTSRPAACSDARPDSSEEISDKDTAHS